jgi:hypothetical protein
MMTLLQPEAKADNAMITPMGPAPVTMALSPEAMPTFLG